MTKEMNCEKCGDQTSHLYKRDDEWICPACRRERENNKRGKI